MAGRGGHRGRNGDYELVSILLKTGRLTLSVLEESTWTHGNIQLRSERTSPVWGNQARAHAKPVRVSSDLHRCLVSKEGAQKESWKMLLLEETFGSLADSLPLPWIWESRYLFEMLIYFHSVYTQEWNC